MHRPDDSPAQDRAHVATLTMIADLALDDLPEVARLVLATSTASLTASDRRDLLVRAYDVAFDAGHEYLAELLDLAIRQFVRAPVP